MKEYAYQELLKELFKKYPLLEAEYSTNKLYQDCIINFIELLAKTSIRAFSSYTSMELEVLRYHFGFNTGESMTYDEVTEVMNISRLNVLECKFSAFAKLATSMEKGIYSKIEVLSERDDISDNLKYYLHLDKVVKDEFYAKYLESQEPKLSR